MSTDFTTITIIEFLACCVAIWLAAHDEELKVFEQNIKRIVKGNYKRFKRKLRERKDLNKWNRNKRLLKY